MGTLSSFFMNVIILKMESLLFYILCKIQYFTVWIDWNRVVVSLFYLDNIFSFLKPLLLDMYPSG